MNTDKDYNEAIERIAVTLRDKIITEIARKGLYDTGELYRSVDYEIEGNDILIYANSYLPYAEFGRGPGKVPYNFANIIAQWAARKNIHLNKGTYNDFGWAVAQKTKQYGSARFRGVIPTADVLSQPVEDVMNNTLNEEFAGVLTAMIMSKLDNLLDL